MENKITTPMEPLSAKEFLKDAASRAAVNRFNEAIESTPRLSSPSDSKHKEASSALKAVWDQALPSLFNLNQQVSFETDLTKLVEYHKQMYSILSDCHMYDQLKILGSHRNSNFFYINLDTMHPNEMFLYDDKGKRIGQVEAILKGRNDGDQGEARYWNAVDTYKNALLQAGDSAVKQMSQSKNLERSVSQTYGRRAL